MREAAGTLKRLSLELGGKSPNIVFADADIDAAVRGAMTGIFYNKGEVCAAGSRLFLEQSIHDEFMAKLTDAVKTLKVGDPLDKATRMGPVVSKAQMETVLSYIEDGKREGAQRGGGRPSRAGRQRQGLLRGAHDLRRGHERDEDRPRGDLRPGALGHPVPSSGGRDRAGQRRPPTGWPPRCGRATSSKALKAAKAIRAGTVWVNAYNLFDAALPFGGFKESGFGREMGSVGLDHYTEVKTVWVDLS